MAKTTVWTTIRTIKVVSGGHTVEIDSLSMQMESEHSLRRGDQTVIRVMNKGQTDPAAPLKLIQNLRIDGIRYEPEYAPGITSQLTYDDIKNAYEDANYRAKHGKLFKVPPGHSGNSLPAVDGVVLCSIVSGIQNLPDDKTKPVHVGDSPNEIVIKNFGTVALGEMFVYTHERRLTLVRLALGSPAKGDGTLGEIGIDGNNWPP
jgi:hypothetical protein